MTERGIEPPLTRTKIVYKYLIEYSPQEIRVPWGAKVLHAGKHYGQIYVWMLVDIAKSEVSRKFTVVGTGEYLASDAVEHVTTFFDKAFVWHVFEVLDA